MLPGPGKKDLTFCVRGPTTSLDGCYPAGMPADRTPTNPQNIGLCGDCRHARRIESDRGSLFLLCQLALTDPRFRKYPRLPVLACDGFQKKDEPATTSKLQIPNG